MNFKRKFICILISLSIVICFAGCVSNKETAEDSTVSDNENISQLVSTNDIFTDNDIETGYDEAASVNITLSDNSSNSTSDAAFISGNTVTIKNDGTYILSGSLSDGSVIVDSTKNAKIRIVLNNVNIAATSTAPIYIKQADKVFITTATDSVNSLTVNGEFVNTGEDNIDSVIFSKDDLTLNGTGTLNISTQYGHGIVSKDDLKLTSGTYNITAASHAVSGKDCVCIAGGNYTFESGKDSIHSENNDDTALGYVYISGGTFDLTSSGDGVSSSVYTQIDGGKFSILAGGGNTNGETHMDNMFPGGMMGGYSSTEEDTVSAKGIKAGGQLVIAGGEFNIDSADDAIHSNADIKISDGIFTLSTGDDGFHADSNTSINGGTITINTGYEGIEGHTIDINGGNITLKASDDGLNAAGGNDESGMNGFGGRNDVFANDSDAYIKITGGKLIADADGDGIDSNGALYVSGGETYVAGPTNSGNGALDYGGEAQISGGIFIATGAAGMATNFGSASTQGVAMVNISSAQTDKIEIFDDNGNSLASYTPNKAYNNIVISCPGMSKGNTYSLTCGSVSTEIEMTDTVYGSGGGMGGTGGMGGHGGMNGGKPRW